MQTTHDRLMQALTSEQRKEYDTEYHKLLVSELLLAIIKKDFVSARKLLKAIEIASERVL